MKIELKEINQDTKVFHFTETPETLELETGEAWFDKPIEVEIKVNPTADQFFCEGKINTLIKLECSRCLLIFEKPVETKFSFVVNLRGTGKTSDSDEEDFISVDAQISSFDVDAQVREALLLAVPMKPLCSEDCKGLCPVCGANLNLTSCKCVKERTDPRWEKLKGLFNK